MLPVALHVPVPGSYELCAGKGVPVVTPTPTCYQDLAIRQQRRRLPSPRQSSMLPVKFQVIPAANPVDGQQGRPLR